MTPPLPSRRWLLLATLSLTLLLSGCAITDIITGGNKNAPPPPPAGLYRSSDRGDTWAPKNAILSAGPERPNLNATSVVTLLMDPTDRQTFYLGSLGQGLFYTYDSGESWWASGPIRSGTVNAVAVPNVPAERCTVYVATANRILRTVDCGRFWDQQYYDTRLQERVLSLAVHRDNPAVVYAGLSTGDLIRSRDSGKSWETIVRLPGAVTRIIPHALNSSVVYATVGQQGIWKTTDGGATWRDLNEGLRQFAAALNVRDLAVDPARPETVVLASPYGLVRTTDGGATWSALSLLTPPNRAPISALALNPVNAAEIYYTTDTTLYRSKDAGETWETRTLPVPGAETTLIVDPKVGNTLYLGVNRPPPQ